MVRCTGSTARIELTYIVDLMTTLPLDSSFRQRELQPYPSTSSTNLYLPSVKPETPWWQRYDGTRSLRNRAKNKQ